jgi:hypothetical protein
MESIKDDTIGGFNAYLTSLQQAAGAGGEIHFSLVSFNSTHTRKRYVAEPIADVRPLSAADYQPQDSTPLIDASVKIINATAEAVAQRADDPKVVVVIQTDGHENVSVEYTNADLAALVKEKSKAGWEFVFLGAGLDAFQAAHQAGLVLEASRVVSYGRGRSREVFAAAASNLADFVASGDADSLRWSDAQRAQVGDEYTPRGGAPGRRGSRRSPASPSAPGRPGRASGSPANATATAKARRSRSTVDDVKLS